MGMQDQCSNTTVKHFSFCSECFCSLWAPTSIIYFCAYWIKEIYWKYDENINQKVIL